MGCVLLGPATQHSEGVGERERPEIEGKENRERSGLGGGDLLLTLLFPLALSLVFR